MHAPGRWPLLLLQSPQTLTHLHLYDQHIASLSSIPNLSQCHALSELTLHSNQVSSLAPSPSFSFTGPLALSLLRLDLSSNQIASIEGLSALVHLQSLNLASNRVSAVRSSPPSLPPLFSAADLRAVTAVHSDGRSDR